jgi:hypothetical protein
MRSGKSDSGNASRLPPASRSQSRMRAKSETITQRGRPRSSRPAKQSNACSFARSRSLPSDLCSTGRTPFEGRDAAAIGAEDMEESVPGRLRFGVFWRLALSLLGEGKHAVADVGQAERHGRFSRSARS